MGIVITSAFNKRSANISETRSNLWQLSDLIADLQQDIVFSAQQSGSTLARIPELQHYDIKTMERILEDRQSITTYCSALIISDNSGKVIASFPRNKTMRSIADRKSFKRAKASHLFSSGEYSANAAANNTFFDFAYPIISANGVFTGAVVIEISRQVFEIVHKHAASMNKPNFTIMDHKGIVLYSHLYPNFVGTQDRKENFATMQNGKDSGDFFTAPGNDGILRLLYFRKAHLEHEAEPYLFIRTSKPTDLIVETANRELLITVISFGAISLAAFILVLIIGRRSIADRVEAVETAALRLAKGDLSVRVSQEVIGGELGRLAEVFDRMAEQLEERDRLLKEFDNELIESYLNLQALNQKIEETREEERHHIARELHDQMGQTLTGLSLDLTWLVAQLDRETVHKYNHHIIDIHISVESLIVMVQNITASLSPPLLDNLGLAPAIGHYIQDFELKSGITCHLMLDEDVSECFDKNEAVAIFRILQEAMTNVARHAQAQETAVSLCLTLTSVVLEVADNGVGITFDKISSPMAFGVLGMQERAKKCGGSLLINRNHGGGTIVRLEIPHKQRGGIDESIGS